MSLPTSGTVPLVGPSEGRRPKPAYLIKFPEEAWSALQDAAGSGIEISIGGDGEMTLNIPNQPPVKLEPRPTGNPSEIHTFTSAGPSSSLSLTAIASTRLSVPITSAFTARAADKLKAQNDAIDKERKERAVRVESTSTSTSTGTGKAKARPVERLAAAGATMGRTHSSPAMGSAPVASASTSGNGHPMIPLKTRVMQLLALGSTTVADIVRRVGGDEQNVMRVVNVVGRASPTSPPTYTLLPNQYSKIKIGPGQWKYTYAEQQQVVRLAREAFDELGLPADAEERFDLDKKEQEAMNGYQSSAGSVSSGDSEKPLAAHTGLTHVPTSQHPPTVTVEASMKKEKRTESPAPTASRAKTTTDGTTSKKAAPQSKIAKERAKFMAEQKRATSLPNVKGVDGTASPRVTPAKVGEPTEKNGKRKRDASEKNIRESYDYSSDEGGEPLRGRMAAVTREKEKEREKVKSHIVPTESDKEKEKIPAGTGYKIPKKNKTTTIHSSPARPPREVDYTSNSSGEEGEIRGRPPTADTSSVKRKKAPPPPPLPLEARVNGNAKTREEISTSLPVHPTSAPIIRSTSYPGSTSASHSRSSGSGSGSGSHPDPEALRDRYEELFPAYEQLTKKLMKVHKAAESGEEVGFGEEEVAKMVGKFERWHKELAEIRRWFGEK
ncbi:hypothetical protein CI109_106645 [Kwoniella shandongensis]|uniref:Uncharacterized protein n=1 Tax=Kwoniella shandongensis TaxID=1734106 RepID=A0A5M6BTX1_9TREE|nr:uncharacterized protein CI109_007209 [Kwoniella shandongensis]KAA5524459.1 hypothetical protein CI109_007209 [Kwoniella shandongensis]